MADFFRTNPNSATTFMRGAARLLWAGSTISFPTKIADVINMSLFDAQTGWNDLGATKTGIQLSVNNQEETFDVDQILADIASRPTAWDVQAGTQIAETSLANLALAWEGSAITTDNSPASGPEQEMGIGNPTVYSERRIAILFQRSDGKIRGFFLRRANRTPQDSTMTFAKTGEQITVPMRWKTLADVSVSDVYKRFLVIRDQV